MDEMIVNYFGGLSFVCGGVAAGNSLRYMRQFKDHYYGIQHRRDGLFMVEVGDICKRIANGARATITRDAGEKRLKCTVRAVHCCL